MQNKQRLWVVSELYYPELTSTGAFMTQLAEGLADSFAVGAVCGQPSYLQRGTRAPWHEVHHGVSIFRCRATTFDKNKLLGRVVNLLTASVSLFLTTLRQIRRGDIVLAVTNPPLLPYLVAVACRLRGGHFVLRVEDVYPEVLTRLNMLGERNPGVRLMHRASRWLYRQAERIVVLGRDMQRLVDAKLPHGDTRSIFLPNWGDAEGIYPEPRESNRLLARLGLQDKFVVQYCGNIGRTHGMEDLLDAARKLATHPDIHVLLIGWGAKKAWVLQQKEQGGLPNLTVLPPLAEDEFRDGLNACDLSLISFAPGMEGISVPSRMYNVLASGKPIVAVCDAGSELAEMVREEGVGFVVPPLQPAQLANAILYAQAHPEEAAAQRERARAAFLAKYTRQHVLATYRTLLAEVGRQ